MSESTQFSKKIAYFDCPTGIAGDMCLGALADAGVPLDYLTEQLNRLGLSGEFELRAEKVLRQGQAATRVKVVLAAPSTHSRHLEDIEQLILKAQLPPRAAEWSLAIFRRLAEAEGAVHGIAPSEVHFHEVGAVDAIVDIVGTCLGLDWLQVDRLSCSALPTGGGLVRAAHGWLPVPAPAVLKLLQMGQVPVYGNGLQKELVTPTGAAIATTLADHFGPPPAMTLQQVGLGAGGHDLPIPNLLRLWIGQAPDGLMAVTSKMASVASTAPAHSHAPAAVAAPPPAAAAPHLEPVTVLETQVDDLSPQAIGYLYERLWAVGALDVFTQAVGMKKSRPGVLLTVICQPDQTPACEQALFEETTTLGIRRQLQWRHALTRTLRPIATPYGSVQLKLAYHPETHQLMNVHPEFEDCAQLARQHQVPWQEVHRSALSQWYGQHPPQLDQRPNPQPSAAG
ncbi:MAG: nickel pincer cofactor biosynthesis protein LarC [Cyanobacteria bacterium Co-bin13]|nr:nickel pincer cofactor biosynthesis protein LarC [Cyanobacteria bacterium Co-bin13]